MVPRKIRMDEVCTLQPISDLLPKRWSLMRPEMSRCITSQLHVAAYKGPHFEPPRFFHTRCYVRRHPSVSLAFKGVTFNKGCPFFQGFCVSGLPSHSGWRRQRQQLLLNQSRVGLARSR